MWLLKEDLKKIVPFFVGITLIINILLTITFNYMLGISYMDYLAEYTSSFLYVLMYFLVFILVTFIVFIISFGAIFVFNYLVKQDFKKKSYIIMKSKNLPMYFVYKNVLIFSFIFLFIVITYLNYQYIILPQIIKNVIIFGIDSFEPLALHKYTLGYILYFYFLLIFKYLLIIFVFNYTSLIKKYSKERYANIFCILFLGVYILNFIMINYTIESYALIISILIFLLMTYVFGMIIEKHTEVK